MIQLRIIHVCMISTNYFAMQGANVCRHKTIAINRGRLMLASLAIVGWPGNCGKKSGKKMKIKIDNKDRLDDTIPMIGATGADRREAKTKTEDGTMSKIQCGYSDGRWVEFADDDFLRERLNRETSLDHNAFWPDCWSSRDAAGDEAISRVEDLAAGYTAPELV